MRKGLMGIVMGALLLAMNGSASALVVFDFDTIPLNAGPAVIESYMEGVYGSDITVKHATVGNGSFSEPLGPDHYLQNVWSWSEHWFSISFNEVPITSVSFDWGVEIDHFHAYADGVEIFNQGWGWWSSGNSGTIDLLAVVGSPVTTLKFTNSYLGEIHMDNLAVEPIPEPASLLLLGSGLLGLAAFGRARRKRS